ncbi:thiamine phosphate synthase [bacterium]|nr:thiamine phosphate synthase [bacterium]
MDRRPPLGLARLYPIVDLRPDRATRALELASVLVEAGAPWIQVRAKAVGDATFLDFARRIVRIAQGTGSRVLVNDRCDVALLCGASGVHLGQDDLPIAEARRILGADAIVGISTHDEAEARRAEREGADYVGFGAVYPTASKADATVRRGPAAVTAIRAAVALPIVAIGGIDVDRADEVLAAGANAVAMIGALETAADPAALVRRWAARA